MHRVTPNASGSLEPSNVLEFPNTSDQPPVDPAIVAFIEQWISEAFAEFGRVVTSAPVRSSAPAPRQATARPIVGAGGAFGLAYAPLFKLSRETKTA